MNEQKLNFVIGLMMRVRRQIKEAAKVVEMFKSHKTGIVEVLNHRLSNAMARLNGKIQEVKRAGRRPGIF